MVVSSLNVIHLMNTPALDFINLLIELMIATPAKEVKDQQFRNQKLTEIIRKISTGKEQLESMMFMLLVSKILFNALRYIPSIEEETIIGYQLMRRAIVDKFVAMMDFILKAEPDDGHYEIFCNMFYYLLTSEKLKLREKLQALNRFFVLNGHHALISVIKESAKKTTAKCFKSRVVMAEIINIFLKFMGKLPDTDVTWKKRSYEIVFNADLKLMQHHEDIPTIGTMMMFIVLKFIDFVWKKREFNKTEVLSRTSLIIAVTKLQKVELEPIFFNMLTTLYTSSFMNVSIKQNKLLETTSATILTSIANIKTIDLSFLKWWKVMGKPRDLEFNKVLSKFMMSSDGQQLENMEPESLKIFDSTQLIRSFVDSSTPIIAHTNIAKVLCNFQSIGSSQDYLKLLVLLKTLQSTPLSKKRKHHEEQLINTINVICASSANFKDVKMKTDTSLLLFNMLYDRTATEHMKLAAIQVTTNFLNSAG